MSRKDGICYCLDTGCPKNADDAPANCPLRPDPVLTADVMSALRDSLAQHPQSAKKPKAKKEKSR